MKEFVKMSREITQTGIEGGKERGTQMSADATDGPLHSGQGELRDMSKFIKDQSRLG